MLINFPMTFSFYLWKILQIKMDRGSVLQSLKDVTEGDQPQEYL